MESIHFTNPKDNGSLVFNQLQDERQDVCDAMLHRKPYATTPTKTQQPRLELMQSRLTQIDDALDRIASGLFGYCTTCGKTLEEERLNRDAAVSECATCEESEKESTTTNAGTADGLAISTRQPFDVIHVQTNHSSYRFLLIDPATGRSLVEGGKYFSEPTEATILGSSTRSAAFRSGWVGIGSRLELCAADLLISTSEVVAVQVERSITEQLLSEVSALHC
jgi:RNA polymerase-binding transcription factor DksA